MLYTVLYTQKYALNISFILNIERENVLQVTQNTWPKFSLQLTLLCVIRDRERYLIHLFVLTPPLFSFNFVPIDNTGRCTHRYMTYIVKDTKFSMLLET